MKHVLKAAVLYFAGVFALGFVLGVVRVGWWSVHYDATRFAMLEVPLLILASWWLCRRLLRRYRVPNLKGRRALMGGTAFVLLMSAELLLVQSLGQGIPEYLAATFEPHRLLGLLGQVIFGLMPLLIERRALYEEDR